MSNLKGFVFAFELEADKVIPTLTKLVKELGYTPPTQEDKKATKVLRPLKETKASKAVPDVGWPVVEVARATNNRVMVAVHLPAGETLGIDVFEKYAKARVLHDLKLVGIVE